MLLRRFVAALAAAGSVVATCAAQKPPAPPPTPKHPVVNTYQGVKVTDDYRWLEDGASPQTKAWVAAQNAYTRAYLRKLPQRAPILDFLTRSEQQAPVKYTSFASRGGALFAMKYEPTKSGGYLVRFDSPENKASEKIVADMNTFLPGRLLQMDWYQPSPNGKLVGMALSSGGSEEGSLYVVEAATGKRVDAVIPRVQFGTGGGSMAWKSDGSGFYYTRYPRPGERPPQDTAFYQQVYFHRMGTPPGRDVYVLGKDFPRVAETTLRMSHSGQQLLVTVANGDGGQYEIFELGNDNQARAIAQFADKVVAASFGADDSLWLLSRKKADRGQILHLPPGQTDLAAARVMASGGNASIEGSGAEPDRFLATNSYLYFTVINGGPEQVRVYDLQGRMLGEVPLPPVASVTPLTPLGGDRILYGTESYTEPEAWYEYEGNGAPKVLPFRSEEKIRFSDISVRRLFATSRDGTQVPMTVLMRNGTSLNGANPTLLTGYGGYAISTTPHFLGASSRLWFDAGGIFVTANLRGGGEYGESWHQAGSLTHKQNVFDDFAACAQLLFARKYTSPERLAIEGGSNGGLLMGAELTQHPEMFRVVLSFVGIYDMLRVELDPNGAFNVTEYGSVKDPEQFRALYAYSPYHHVKPGTKYPAVFFVTGDNDPRVNPAHSRKMTAALQAASASGLPVMLLTSSNAGHGLSTHRNEALEQEADYEAFLFAQLGMKAPSNGAASRQKISGAGSRAEASGS